MKFKILAGLALTTVALAACKVEVNDDGIGGNGGSADTVTVTSASSTKAASTTTNTSNASTNNVSANASTTGSGVVCADEATCLECQNCAAEGACSAEAADCGQGSACDMFNTCLGACPPDNPSTMDVDEELDCICTNDGAQCLPAAMQMPGTCIGDNPNGLQPFLAFSTCLFGDDGTGGECGANADCAAP